MLGERVPPKECAIGIFETGLKNGSETGLKVVMK